MDPMSTTTYATKNDSASEVASEKTEREHNCDTRPSKISVTNVTSSLSTLPGGFPRTRLSKAVFDPQRHGTPIRVKDHAIGDSGPRTRRSGYRGDRVGSNPTRRLSLAILRI